VRDRPGWPERITLALERRQELRYGENPHQAAALYAVDEPGIRDVEQLHGKELSFNNLLDVDAALAAVAPWSGSDRAACAIIKHTTPCGIALGPVPAAAYERALATDRTSAFGSVIAFNAGVDRPAVRLGGRRDSQVERDPARPARGRDRHRRRADVADGCLVSRGPQGAPARPRSGWCSVSFRRVLSVRRRGRRGSPRRGARDYPARRLGQRRRGDRGRRSARASDGGHGRPAVPALTT